MYSSSTGGKMMRTPPKLGEASSYPDLFCTPEIDSDRQCTNAMKKRKYPVDSCEDMTKAMNDMCINMQQMFKDLRVNQDVQFTQINENMCTLKKQNEELLMSNVEIQRTMSDIICEHKELKSRVQALENNYKEKSVEDFLKDQQLENLERKIKDTSVEIRNLPVENNIQMLEAIEKLHKVLEVGLERSDIRSSYRLPSKEGRTRPVIVEFTTTQKKMELLRAIKAYNIKNKDNKLNTSNINVPGEKKIIYVSEYLTKKAKHLHYLSRELVKKGDWKFCWINNGRIFLRKEEGQPVIEVRSVEQLDPNATIKD